MARIRKTNLHETAREQKAQARDWFGHPAGLTFLFGAEMWERFSFYGMRALLLLYMVDELLRPERQSAAIGLPELKRALEALSGPLDSQPLASQIYGLYTGFVYLTPVFGGLLADRFLGRRRTVAIGATLMVAGHFLMASEAFFLVALALLVLGNGAFKPNVVTQVGGLYAPEDRRRDRAYSIFYLGINIGAFFSPLVAGTLGETLGWHYGFAAAGVGMTIGLAIFLLGLPYLPPDPPLRERAPPALSEAPLGRSFAGVLLLFAPSILFWTAYEQQGNTIALWADRIADRRVDLLFWRGEIPVTWFQSFNPAMIFLFTAPLVAFWARLARAGREPDTVTKLTLGCVGLGLANLVMALADFQSAGGKASWLWLALYFVVLTLGELHFVPIALSLLPRVAPVGAGSSLVGLWFTTNFFGGLVAGWLGGFWSRLSGVAFFSIVAGVAFLAAGLVLLAQRRLRGLLDAASPFGAGAASNSSRNTAI
jgi:POT family proton-dependent oligopeptide transporter